MFDRWFDRWWLPADEGTREAGRRVTSSSASSFRVAAAAAAATAAPPLISAAGGTEAAQSQRDDMQVQIDRVDRLFGAATYIAIATAAPPLISAAGDRLPISAGFPVPGQLRRAKHAAYKGTHADGVWKSTAGGLAWRTHCAPQH